MIVWKKGAVDSDMDWILADEDDENNIIAFLTVLENPDGTCNAEAVSEKIRYKIKFENLDKTKLKTIVPYMKRSVTYAVDYLREENKKKPNDKKIYKMIDGIPMWKHLKNGAEETEIHLKANDYGKLTEILGNRILKDVIRRGEILDNIFPGLDIISIQFINQYKILDEEKIGIGDVVLEVDYRKEEDKYGKKIVIFEIKHGKIIVRQNQLRRYCSMILKPDEYFHKADEVKVIYMMFDDIDTLNASAYYSIQELDKDFARKVLEQIPIENSQISIY